MLLEPSDAWLRQEGSLSVLSRLAISRGPYGPYGPDSAYACWLIFRLCLLPLLPYREQFDDTLWQ